MHDCTVQAGCGTVANATFPLFPRYSLRIALSHPVCSPCRKKYQRDETDYIHGGSHCRYGMGSSDCLLRVSDTMLRTEVLSVMTAHFYIQCSKGKEGGNQGKALILGF